MKQSALFAAVALAVILAAAWLVTTVAERRRRAVQGRITAVLTGAPLLSAASGGSMSLRRPVPTGTVSGLQLLPAWFHRYLVDELGATGDRLKIASLLRTVLIGTLLVGGLLYGLVRLPLLAAVPVALMAGVAAAHAHLRLAQRRFQRHFLERFPEALDVIVRAVRAGLPVLDAMEAAAGDVAEPIAGEFRRLLDQWRIGIDLEASLEPAAERIRVNDFRFFAATLVLQRRTGGSLAETLADLAGLIRRRKEVRLKVRALSAESRASAYVIGALPFILTGVMYLLNPEMTSLLFTDHRGKVILGIAIVMLGIGFAVMNAMINKAAR
jgi:tight adherence protein B